MRDGWEKKIAYERTMGGTFVCCKLTVTSCADGGWDYSVTYDSSNIPLGGERHRRHGNTKTFRAALSDAETLADEMLTGCAGYKKASNGKA